MEVQRSQLLTQSDGPSVVKADQITDMFSSTRIIVEHESIAEGKSNVGDHALRGGDQVSCRDSHFYFLLSDSSKVSVAAATPDSTTMNIMVQRPSFWAKTWNY